MAAPKVQSVEQIISELNPAYQGSINVINKRMQQLPEQFKAQQMGLDAAKGRGFSDINNQATARGMSFSGVPIHEQSRYLSEKYLPGMQQLTQQENDMTMQLEDALAKINQERRLGAMDIRRGQQASVEGYLSEQRERAWQREQFQAEQAMQRAKMAQDDRQFNASQQSSNQQAPIQERIRAMLATAAGDDGRVSPTAWKQIAAYAADNGIGFQGDKGFANQYWQYANDSHYQDYLGDPYKKYWR